MSNKLIVAAAGFCGILMGWVGSGHDVDTSSGLTGIDEEVRVAAKALNSVTPRSLNGAGQLTSVTANGKVIDFHISSMIDWRRDFSDQEMVTMNSVAACETARVRQLIKRGMSVRLIGTDSQGTPLPTLTIAHCPEYS